MAYIVDYALTYAGGGAISNIAMNMPAHQTGDLLVALVTMNSGAASVGASSNPAAANWTILSNATNASHTLTTLRALATSATNALFLTTADDYCCTILSIRDVGGTTAADAVDAIDVTGSTTSTAVPANLAVTPVTTDCLILYLMAIDGIAVATHSTPGIHNVISYDNQGGTAGTAATQGLGWYIHRPANQATPTPSWIGSAAGVSARATIAIKNKTEGIIPAYIGDNPAPASHILGGQFTANTVGTLVAYNTAFSMTGNMTNGKTTSFVAQTAAAGADLGINPFSSAPSKTGALQAATALTGWEIIMMNAAGNTPTARNFSTGGLVVGSVVGGTPKMGAFGIGSVSEGGCVVRIGSSGTAWKAYQIAAKDAQPSTDQRSVFAIQPGYVNSQYGSAGAYAPNSTLFMQFLSNQPSFISTVNWCEIYYATVHTVCGGTSTAPVDTLGMAQIGKSYRIPVIQKSGGSGLLSYVPIQIGGQDAVNFQIDGGSLQFPRTYDARLKEIAFHADSGIVGITYDGRSGDVIKHTNSVITSPNTYYWAIASTANTLTTWDFSGTSVVNAFVTTRPVLTFTRMTFSDAKSFETNGASFQSCIFDGSVEILANSASFTDCTFSNSTANTTTEGALSITGASEAALQTELNKLVRTTFINNTSNAALELIYTGTAGPITLSMTTGTFSGNSKDIRWVAPASSNLTINLSGTADATSNTATNNNIVTLQSTKTFTITNIVANTEIRILKQSDISVIAGAEDVGNTDPQATNLVISADTENTISGRYKAVYSYNFPVLNGGNNLPIFVVAHSLSQQWLRSGFTIKNVSESLQISQIPDRQYQNP